MKNDGDGCPMMSVHVLGVVVHVGTKLVLLPWLREVCADRHPSTPVLLVEGDDVLTNQPVQSP